MQGESAWPKTCPVGFAQHLATTERQCEIHYCVKTGSFKRPQPVMINRPPYGESAPPAGHHESPKDTIVTESGEVWKKQSNESTAKWKVEKLPLKSAGYASALLSTLPDISGAIDPQPTIAPTVAATTAGGGNAHGSGTSTIAEYASIAIGSALGVGLAIFFVFTMFRRVRRKQEDDLLTSAPQVRRTESTPSIDPSVQNDDSGSV